MAQNSDCGKNCDGDKKSTSEKVKEKVIVRRVQIVAPFLKPAAKSLVMGVLLCNSVYFSWTQPGCRAAFIQMTGVVISAFVAKAK